MSQFAAVTWKVKPCFDEEPAWLFENYQRPDSFVITDDQGSQTCAMLATAMFLKDHRIVRLIEYEGELAMRCPVARRHDQLVAAVSEARGDR